MPIRPVWDSLRTPLQLFNSTARSRVVLKPPHDVPRALRRALACRVRLRLQDDLAVVVIAKRVRAKVDLGVDLLHALVVVLLVIAVREPVGDDALEPADAVVPPVPDALVDERLVDLRAARDREIPRSKCMRLI